MKELYKCMQVMKESPNAKFAMATIIQVKGSSYRREGAKMLIGSDGEMFGTISAGCLEEDLYYQALRVLETKETKTVSYDLRSEDDLSWGQGAGCNGKIDVYIEPFYWNYIPNYYDSPVSPSVYQYMNKGKRIVSVKYLGDQIQPEFLLFYSDNQQLLTEPYQTLIVDDVIKPYLEGFLSSGLKTKMIKINGFENQFLFEINEPKDPLFVFGAGPDAEPLVELASKLDYSVTVIDPRSSRCSNKKFPSADFLYAEHPEKFLKETQLPSYSYVIVMTHNFNRDQQILRHLADVPLQYLGVLGPKDRTSRLLSSKSMINKIHSPIGLNIGADGPEEISVSIMAELIKIRSEKSVFTLNR
ncbi:XdhC family protein [Scopulibacillus cellulosilyticus]|uniref:XdhC family protein n=1 Tax=Scopulibacillus cellulosilyticus TaxID=2665665 RepID=A0ABW2PUP0_9BACL